MTTYIYIYIYTYIYIYIWCRGLVHERRLAPDLRGWIYVRSLPWWRKDVWNPAPRWRSLLSAGSLQGDWRKLLHNLWGGKVRCLKSSEGHYTEYIIVYYSIQLLLLLIVLLYIIPKDSTNVPVSLEESLIWQLKNIEHPQHSLSRPQFSWARVKHLKLPMLYRVVFGLWASRTPQTLSHVHTARACVNAYVYIFFYLSIYLFMIYMYIYIYLYTYTHKCRYLNSMLYSFIFLDFNSSPVFFYPGLRLHSRVWGVLGVRFGWMARATIPN